MRMNGIRINYFYYYYYYYYYYPMDTRGYFSSGKDARV
jgi:hypothetical protein